jgi:hypothetical protein
MGVLRQLGRLPMPSGRTLRQRFTKPIGLLADGVELRIDSACQGRP